MLHKNKLNELTKNRATFFNFVNKTTIEYRQHDPGLYLYNEIFRLRNKFSIEDLLKMDGFYDLLYTTLIAWNMNQRAAKLVRFEDFKKSIEECDKKIIELDKYSLEKLDQNELNSILEKLKDIFFKIRVMGSRSQIVGLSKALHYLLPNLIMPIDRKYTMSFFYGHNKYYQDLDKEFKTFKEIFIKFYEITKRLKLTKHDLTNKLWNQSIPKLIDNALIGFRKSRER